MSYQWSEGRGKEWICDICSKASFTSITEHFHNGEIQFCDQCHEEYLMVVERLEYHINAPRENINYLL